MIDSVQHFFENLFRHLRLVDVLDVALIAVFLYLALVWLRRAASRAALATLMLVLVIYFLARTFDMYLTSMLFQFGFTVILLGLVLIFQEDIRRGLESLTAWGLRRDSFQPPEMRVVDVLVESVAKLAELRIGALLVFQGRHPLDRHIRGGVPVRGEISLPLLQSIFDPHSPGHDGAVLIEGQRIEMLGVHLPLSENLRAVGESGTRHAAGLGLSERTDALVVIVSEERGTISVASAGGLETLGSPTDLKPRLEAYYGHLHPRGDERWGGLLTRNLGLKVASLATACLLWGVFAYQMDSVQETLDGIPVEYRNLPRGWGVEPLSVRVTVSGTERALRLLNRDALRLSVDMEGAEIGTQEIPLASRGNLNLPPRLMATWIEPNSPRLTVYRMEPRLLPVRINASRLPASVSLRELSVEPSHVRVQVRLDGGLSPVPDQILTEPVDLNSIRQSPTGSAAVKLALPPNVQLIDSEQGTVHVRLSLAEKRSEPTPSAGKL